MNLNNPVKYLIAGIMVFLVSQVYGTDIPQKYFIAIEFNKVICGFSEITISDSTINGKELKVLSQEVHFDFSALGRDMSQYQRFIYHIDPVSWNFIFHESYHKQGDITRGASFFVDENKIRIKSLDNPEFSVMDLPDDIILPNTVFYNHLKNDFAEDGTKEKSYSIYNLRSGEIIDTDYKKTGEEELELAGCSFNAIIIDEKDPATGGINKLWIDKETGLRLKLESVTHIKMFLADESVKGKVKKGKWDDVVLGKTNKHIPGIRSITYMKADVRLEALPAPHLSDLSYRGQEFDGKITGNRIDGIFEISHKPYNGKNSPVFPLDTSKYEGLGRWLNPTPYIESDDSVLVSVAKRITNESGSLWDAAHRISNWIIENIDGAILDGTARQTFDAGKGMCGAQSMLMAALCRAVGIPARVVWGVMYTHELGGSFGHHGWNEVFMGEDGWIPLDVTSHESNYIDSGHIRLGIVLTSQTVINYDKMFILDYKTSK